MKVETAMKHIRVWMDSPSVSQIVVHKQPKTNEVMLEIKKQYKTENDVTRDTPHSNR